MDGIGQCLCRADDDAVFLCHHLNRRTLGENEQTGPLRILPRHHQHHRKVVTKYAAGEIQGFTPRQVDIEKKPIDRRK